MKPTTLVILLLFPVLSWSQVSLNRSSAPVNAISNSNRLYIDFEIKDNSTPDLPTLNNIDLGQYENLREEETDVEVYDTPSTYTIVLYSNQRAILNKKRGLIPVNSQNE